MKSKGLYLKAFDIYNNKRVLISFEDDEVNFSTFFSTWANWNISIFCTSVKQNNLEFKRWSDLNNIEIISKKEFDSIRNWVSFYKKKNLSEGL